MKVFLREGKKIIRIEEIAIENFQSHKNTKITFEDGLNVIIGASDRGKSAIIRAIKWVLYNEPRGSDYIRQGAGFARVTLKLSNGYTIIRERSSGKNRYILKDKEGNANIFEGFGSEVPYEVVKVHGIPKVILDTDKKTCLNIGEQLEGPFLISESGALRAKAIGRMIGLHILDKSIKDTSTDLRRENQTKDRLNSELEDIDSKLLEFKDLDILKEKLDESENIIQKLENSIRGIERLQNNRLLLENIEDRKVKVKEILLKLNKINEGEMVLKNIELDIEKLNRLLSMQKRFSEVKKNTDDANVILNKTKDVYDVEGIVKKIYDDNLNINMLKLYQNKYNICKKEISNVEKQIKACDNVNEAERLLMKVDEIQKLEKRLTELNEKYKENKERIKDGLNYINDKKAQMEKLLNEYVKILKDRGKCPLCDSLIGRDMIENIIANYREENK